MITESKTLVPREQLLILGLLALLDNMDALTARYLIYYNFVNL